MQDDHNYVKVEVMRLPYVKVGILKQLTRMLLVIMCKMYQLK